MTLADVERTACGAGKQLLAIHARRRLRLLLFVSATIVLYVLLLAGGRHGRSHAAPSAGQRPSAPATAAHAHASSRLILSHTRRAEGTPHVAAAPTFAGRRVFVYEPECRGEDHATALCAFPPSVRPEADGVTCSGPSHCFTHESETWHMYDSDWLVYQLLLTSPARTLDPDDADLFFVPQLTLRVFHECFNNRPSGWRDVDCHNKTAHAYLAPLVDRVTRTPWWQRHGGRDHLFAWTQGAGALPFGEPARRIANATFLTNTGARCHDARLPPLSFAESHDVVLPYLVPHVLTADVALRASAPHVLADRSGSSGSAAAAGATPHRRHLFVMRGTVHADAAYSNCVRQLLLHLYGTAAADGGNGDNTAASLVGDSHPGYVTGGADGDIVVAVGGSSDRYHDDMVHSRYCICAEGWWAWTPRPVKALAAGCVPVIVSDTLRLPGADWLDWEGASVRVSPDDVLADPHYLERTLRSIPDDEYARMAAAAVRLAPFLLWYQNPYVVLDWVLGEAYGKARRSIDSNACRLNTAVAPPTPCPPSAFRRTLSDEQRQPVLRRLEEQQSTGRCSLPAAWRSAPTRTQVSQ